MRTFFVYKLTSIPKLFANLVVKRLQAGICTHPYPISRILTNRHAFRWRPKVFENVINDVTPSPGVWST